VEKLKVCWGCGNVGHNRFCNVCGGLMVPYDFSCPYCKETIILKSKFCVFCGRPVQEAAEVFAKEEMAKDKGGGEK